MKNVNPISDGQKVYENARFAEVHQENEMANLDSVKGIVSPAQVAHISSEDVPSKESDIVVSHLDTLEKDLKNAAFSDRLKSDFK